jgi:hypothetical protein
MSYGFVTMHENVHNSVTVAINIGGLNELEFIIEECRAAITEAREGCHSEAAERGIFRYTITHGEEGHLNKDMLLFGYLLAESGEILS